MTPNFNRPGLVCRSLVGYRYKFSCCFVYRVGLCLLCFKIAHYTLEQCFRILPIMLNLCSIGKVLYSTNSIFHFSYPIYANYKIIVLAVFLVPLQYSTQLTIYLSIYINILNSFFICNFSQCIFWQKHYHWFTHSNNPVKSVHFTQN